ncbi:diguanylate cyclase/phosphodiesterase with PAS/PAC sensor(s) [Sulfurimonas denitrificans DSM 1251]|uniref:Diguanylate cyclase/phosphodiesterase with PAS/PAC sensor(S) n=1 Tax=Sulfurimonas denitrificans (strain ATCC 33889 / DSM 1251) TaxID=326298 RepID=Q30NR9_SULDN|nr:EAL domain-containing protein [Sulfurimonas denitrificans]ABB45362.1 diguanylate cyclase/phosphodiesterase with PAS/PAC sensor(s) [Sulfurimonas denitrificans DSM 1251]
MSDKTYKLVDILNLHPSKVAVEERLNLALNFFESTNEGILIANREGLIKFVNRAFCEITGYTQEEAIGKKPNILKSGIHDIAFYKSMRESLEKNGYWKGEIWDKRKNGEIYPQILSISKNKNSKFSENYYMSVFTDISDIKKSEKKVYYNANYDSLTKLPNRTYFNKELEAILKEADKENYQVALYFIDIDKFKEVNDTHGHNVGDKMLINVSKRLLNSIRENDVIARIGGDEFVLIAKNIKSEENVKQLASNLKKKIKEPMEVDNQIFHVGLSIGVAIYPQHGISSEELLKNADIAMYEVKKSTRDGFKIYDKLMSTKIAMAISIQKDIRKALEEDMFIVYYQPVIDMHTNSIIGAEALVRWNHPQKGILEPESFLQYVLSGDVGREFGCMVFSEILTDLKHINETLPKSKLQISVNISKYQLSNSTFCFDFLNIFERNFINADQLELEIIETEIMQNREMIKKNVEELSLCGFNIAFDNFGTGYSSLSYLRDIKVDKLKIDKSFVKNMLENEKDLNIVKSIIDIGKLFDLKVQAQGVETKEQYIKLKEIGCHFSQGFYHSQPLCVDDFMGYYNKI